MESITICDKKFRLYLRAEEIENALDHIARAINKQFSNKDVIFIAILNGAFMFAADLLKRINFNCRVSFVKLASYRGTKSSGAMDRLIGINEDLLDKTVIILEDIVDTGTTLEELIGDIIQHEPKAVKIASLLFKPDACIGKFRPDFIGFNIPNEFIVGYGLDYNGFGRNLKDIYTIIKS